ncbi:MAG: LamG-like jellyroll fold domain-containing protein, partial [Rhodothermales bacterium]
RYVVLADSDFRGPHEIVLKLRAGESYVSERIAITPVAREGGRLTARDALRIERHVRATEIVNDPDNHVLSFADAQPLLLRRSRIPDLGIRNDFSVSMWFKSLGTGEVLFSTWDGDENRSYPIELVIDLAGRLRCFRGRPGEHQSLASKAPVADGSWHQVVITNEAEKGWMRMRIDGKSADSIYVAVPPNIAMNISAAVGGRVPGKDTYFDGLRSFSGSIDELRISGTEDVRLDFEDRLPTALLQENGKGLKRQRSDLVFRRPIQAFQASAGTGGIALTWRADDRQVKEFVVERSLDGRTFESVAGLPYDESGDTSYSITDPYFAGGVAYYRVRQVYRRGVDRISGVIKVGLGAELPQTVLLIGNFPNPFNATTTISYEVRENEAVRLSVWDLAGQQIALLVNRVHAPGTYEVTFSADNLPSGTYFARMETEAGIRSHKMIL